MLPIGKGSILSHKVKVLLKDAIESFFNKDPQWKDRQIRVINKRSDLSEIPYGIIFRNFTANKVQFDPQNYLGEVYSYVSLARVGNRPSKFVSLVQEDVFNTFRLREDDLSVQANGTNRLFQVLERSIVQQHRDSNSFIPANSPQTILVRVNGKVVLVDSVDGRNGTFILNKPPALGSEVLVSYYYRKLVPAGYYFIEVTSDTTIQVDHFYSKERTPVYFKTSKIRAYFNSHILSTSEIEVLINGDPLPNSEYEIVKPGKYISFKNNYPCAVLRIRNKTLDVDLVEGVDYYSLKHKEQTLLTSALGNEFYFNLPPNAQDYLLYSNGKILKKKTGHSHSFDYEIVSNKIKLVRPLNKGNDLVLHYAQKTNTGLTEVSFPDLFSDASTAKIPTDLNLLEGFLEVYEGGTMLKADEYIFDSSAKTFTLLKPSKPVEYTISFREYADSYEHTLKRDYVNTKILNGVQIHFNNDIEIGDKVVVIVGSERKVCADEYGGKWQAQLDLSVVSPEPISTEDIADKLASFLWGELKIEWDRMGILIEDVSKGGESEDELDAVTGDTDSQESIGLSIQTDWFLRIPRKFRILTLTSKAMSSEVVSPTFDPDISPNFILGNSKVIMSHEHLQ